MNSSPHKKRAGRVHLTGVDALNQREARLVLDVLVDALDSQADGINWARLKPGDVGPLHEAAEKLNTAIQMSKPF